MSSDLSMLSTNSHSDDRLNDTLSNTSSEEYLFDDSVIKNDKHHKAKRRGSGLGNLAQFFKSGLKIHIGNQKGRQLAPPSASGSLPTPEHSESNSTNDVKSKEASEGGQATGVFERTPQKFLDAMWRSRGYDRNLYPALESAYFNEPTPLQLASYHPRLLEMIQAGREEELKALLIAGISHNPSDKEGRTLVHEVCRCGNHHLLEALVSELGANVQICSRRGRTPLHEACLGEGDTPNFSIVDILTANDARLFSLADDEGKTPLDHVPMKHWSAWIDYLYVRRDKYWPRRLVRVDGKEGPPPLVLQGANSRPLPDPEEALALDLVSLMVSGDMTPETAVQDEITIAVTESISGITPENQYD